MKIERERVDYIYLAVIIIIILTFFTGFFGSKTGLTLVVIDNSDPNSMFPTYFQGDLFIIKNADRGDISLGDVIVYSRNRNSDAEVRIIHRVIDIIKTADEIYYRVKGDNPISNSSPDGLSIGNTLIPHEWVIGKTITRIPYIGHISLAMQRSVAIRYLVYLFAGISMIWILLDSDEEEEEEFVELTFRVFITLFLFIFVIIYNLIKRGNEALTKKQYSLLVVLLLFVVIVPSILPTYVGDDTETGVGVNYVKTGSFQLLNDQVGSESFTSYFMQLKISIYDSSGVWERIKGLTLEVYTDKNFEATPISLTKWISYKDFKGTIVIGGSILIQGADAPDNGATLYILITIHSTSFIKSEDKIFTDEIAFKI